MLTRANVNIRIENSTDIQVDDSLSDMVIDNFNHSAGNLFRQGWDQGKANDGYSICKASFHIIHYDYNFEAILVTTTSSGNSGFTDYWQGVSQPLAKYDSKEGQGGITDYNAYSGGKLQYFILFDKFTTIINLFHTIGSRNLQKFTQTEYEPQGGKGGVMNYNTHSGKHSFYLINHNN
jgi:hypothetical protein